MSGSLSILALRVMVGAVARSSPAAVPTLLAELGVSETTLADASARIPADVAFKGFVRAVEVLGDEQLFLKAGAGLPLGALETLDFAVRSSATLGEAMQRLARYYALVDDDSTLAIERPGDGSARIVGQRTSLASPRAATELLFAIILARGRDYIGKDWKLREVCFAQPAPREKTGHAKFFGAPVRYKQPANQLVFDEAFLDLPCRTQDAALASFLDRQLAGLVAHVAKPTSFIDEVRGAIAASIRGSDPLLSATASRLGITARTLQRRLNENGVSHRKLVDEIRRDVAERLLGTSTLPIGEVAFLAGFSDTSAFHHAFVRWCGVTPSAFREKKGP